MRITSLLIDNNQTRSLTIDRYEWEGSEIISLSSTAKAFEMRSIGKKDKKLWTRKP